MRRAPLALFVPLLLGLACTRPEVEAFRQAPTPIRVTVSLPPRLQDRDGLEKEYASALRARLATRAVVVPEGVKPPGNAVELQVDIRDLTQAQNSPSPGAVGVATGVTVGALSAASGNRGWGVMDGLFWGLWAGTHAAAHQERVQDRLGYRPQVVRAQVRLVQPGNREPLWAEAIEPHEVVEAMDPLPRGEREDDGRIREEEARGFARVVVQKLSAEFQWTRYTVQRFYQDPTARHEPAPPVKAEPAAEPKPAPEPKKD
jgi:hypothetical protein